MNRSMIVYILGFILLLLSGFMLLPVIVALIYREQSGWYFLCTALGAAVVGWLCVFRKPKNTAMFVRDGFVIVALSWIVLSMIGAVPFWVSRQIPSYLDAFFETVSGFTTTGSSILTDVEALDHCMLFWRSFTHWLGGMGVLVFILAIVPMAGGQSIHLLRAESPGPSVSKMVPRMRASSMILYGIYLGLTITQFLLYCICGMPVFDGICLTFGTAGTGGFGVLNSSLSGYSNLLQSITTVFMILFGVNFSVYFFILQKKWGLVRTNTELKVYLGIIVCAITAITLNVWFGSSYFSSFYDAFHHSAFTVASIMTTTGFGTADYNLWPQLSRIILVLLMIVGASAGSTGGGLKVSRIILLVKSAANEIHRALHPRVVQVITLDKKKVPNETVQGVASYFIIYVLLIAISVFLVSLDNFDASTTLTSVLATINNIGPGTSLIGVTGNYSIFSPLSKIVLSLDMLFGRLEILPMLVLMLPSTWKSR